MRFKPALIASLLWLFVVVLFSLPAAAQQNVNAANIGTNTVNPNRLPAFSGGQLSGPYSSPAVTGIRETSGPTNLSIGALADGCLLQRSGSTVVSTCYAPVATYTYSALPLASSNAGAVAIVSDLNNCPVMSDGTRWRPLSGRCVVYQRHRSDVDVVTGATAQTEFASAAWTIPAAIFACGPKASLELDIMIDDPAGNSNTFRVTADTSTIANPTATTNKSWRFQGRIGNDGGGTSTQFASGPGNAGSGSGGTSSSFATTVTVGGGSSAIRIYAVPSVSSDVMRLRWADYTWTCT